MKAVGDLNLGFSDAQNYTLRENKQMLSDVFVKNTYLENLIKNNIYYLIGEKGTGKTAYAVYLSNNEYKETKSILKYISGTDYEKFHELKRLNHIDISGYFDIWKTILYLLIAKSIVDNKSLLPLFTNKKLSDLNAAINEYYKNAFSPEIIHALKIVDKSKIAASLFFKYAKAEGEEESILESDEQQLQMNLFYINNKFMDCFKKLKINKNLVLYIDGIDVRPSQIPYNEYLDCIKGLATACWSLNTEIFANVKDSKGHIKIVLLLRPDIFNSLNLQNATNKLADNSVYLDWRTTYTEYFSSNLYKMSNKLILFSQDKQDKQDNDISPKIWEQYFDWKLDSSSEEREFDTAFMEFLKISLCRPRDIQRILALLQNLMIENDLGKETKFNIDIFKSNQFQNLYSEYFLSSLKDQLSFYYSEEDYNLFRKFFDYFENPQFSYSEYLSAHQNFYLYICDNAKEIPQFIENPKEFLQFLYDCNVITAIEKDRNGKIFFHFAYREKSPSNIAPKILYGENILYRFHYGLYKKAKMGNYRY